jgi:hypothetical protein
VIDCAEQVITREIGQDGGASHVGLHSKEENIDNNSTRHRRG